MKGIILAGGSGSRLYPLTKADSKQMLPVYDKPMVYYSLSTLMLAKIQDILIISTPEDLNRYFLLLGDGSNMGLHLEYAEQAQPDGLAQALLIGEEFIGPDSCALILGDNIFYGNGLYHKLETAVMNAEIRNLATVFGYYVPDPERFGVVEFDKFNRVVSLEEKPENPKSNYAVTGLYFYPSGVSQIARQVERSERGEYEITTLNELYLKKDMLQVEVFGRGFSWFDCGTIDSLLDAAVFIRGVEKNQGIEISVPEEIACRNGWITEDRLQALVQRESNSLYSKHLELYLEHRFQ